MKRSIQILSTLLLISGLVMVTNLQSSSVPAVGAQTVGTEFLALDPASAPPGAKVIFRGSFGFSSSQSIRCAISARGIAGWNPVAIMANYQFSTCSTIAFDGSFTVSSTAAFGHYVISVSFDNSISIQQEFDVAPRITITPDSGPAGTVVSVSGVFSSADAYVVISSSGLMSSTETCPVTGGTINCSFTVANAVAPGFYGVYATDISGNQADATFTLTGGGMTPNPLLTLTPINANETSIAYVAVLVGAILVAAAAIVVLVRSRSRARREATMNKRCPSCGYTNEYENSFCSRCGNSLGLRVRITED
jgi:hypothetical protein